MALPGLTEMNLAAEGVTAVPVHPQVTPFTSIVEAMEALTDDTDREGMLYNAVISEVIAMEEHNGYTSVPPMFMLQAFLLYRVMVKILDNDSSDAVRTAALNAFMQRLRGWVPQA